MLFLVKGIVVKTEYYDNPEYKEELRLVEADGEIDAELKFEEFFTSKSRAYDVNYYCQKVTVYPTIK